MVYHGLRTMPDLSLSPLYREGPRTGPVWVDGLLKASYFDSCPQHAAAHKSDRNFYCADCGAESLCQLCVKKRHAMHTIVQVRKSSHHDAVRILEISRLLDIQHIQHYTINGHKIVFLNARPQPKPMKGAVHSCEVCHRTLIDACRFCSIECKQTAAQEGDLSISLQPRVAFLSADGCVEEREAAGNYGTANGASGNWRKRVRGFPTHFLHEDDSDEILVEHSSGSDEEAESAPVAAQRCTKPRSPPALIAASPPSYMAPSTPPEAVRLSPVDVSSPRQKHRRKGIPQRSALW